MALAGHSGQEKQAIRAASDLDAFALVLNGIKNLGDLVRGAVIIVTLRDLGCGLSGSRFHDDRQPCVDCLWPPLEKFGNVVRYYPQGNTEQVGICAEDSPREEDDWPCPVNIVFLQVRDLEAIRLIYRDWQIRLPKKHL